MPYWAPFLFVSANVLFSNPLWLLQNFNVGFAFVILFIWMLASGDC